MDQTYGNISPLKDLAWIDNASSNDPTALALGTGFKPRQAQWAIPAGWKVVDSVAGPMNGKFVVYRNVSTKEVMIVAMGTNGPKDHAGWASNFISYGMQQWVNDPTVAQSVFGLANDALASVGPGAKLIIAGDSKGGALAQFIAASLLNDKAGIDPTVGFSLDPTLKKLKNSDIGIIGRVGPGSQAQLGSAAFNVANSLATADGGIQVFYSAPAWADKSGTTYEYVSQTGGDYLDGFHNFYIDKAGVDPDGQWGTYAGGSVGLNALFYLHRLGYSDYDASHSVSGDFGKLFDITRPDVKLQVSDTVINSLIQVLDSKVPGFKNIHDAEDSIATIIEGHFSEADLGDIGGGVFAVATQLLQSVISPTANIVLAALKTGVISSDQSSVFNAIATSFDGMHIATSDGLNNETFTASATGNGITLTGSKGDVIVSSMNGIQTTVTINNADSLTGTLAADGLNISDITWAIGGAKGNQSFNADGFSSSKIINANGSYTLTSDDGWGNVTVDYYAIPDPVTGVSALYGDSYVHADGTSGTDFFHFTGIDSAFHPLPTASSGSFVANDAAGSLVTPDGTYQSYFSTVADSSENGDITEWQTSEVKTFDANGKALSDVTAKGTPAEYVVASGAPWGTFGYAGSYGGVGDSQAGEWTWGAGSAILDAKLTGIGNAVTATLSQKNSAGARLNSNLSIDAGGNVTIDNLADDGSKLTQDFYNHDGSHGVVTYVAGNISAKYTYELNGYVQIDTYSSSGGLIGSSQQLAGMVASPDGTDFHLYKSSLENIASDGSKTTYSINDLVYLDSYGVTVDFRLTSTGVLAVARPGDDLSGVTDLYSLTPIVLDSFVAAPVLQFAAYDSSGNLSPNSPSSHALVETKGNTKYTEYFNASGKITSDDWVADDGTHGTTVNNVDGSSQGDSYGADGTFFTFQDDGHGNIEHDLYDAAGNNIGDAWWASDGSSGKDVFNADGSSSGTITNADGSVAVYAKDAQGNDVSTETTASGTISSEYFADGSSISKVTNTDGSTSVSTFNSAGIATTTDYDSAQVKVSQHWRLSNGTSGTTVYDANGVASQTDGLTPQFDAAGAVQGDVWFAADGSSGNDTFTLNADATTKKVSNTTYADGTTSIETDDGEGNITTVFFGTDGTKVSDTWSHIDGSYGADTFAADGSSTGTSTASDGSSSSYVTTAAHQTTTSHFDIAGVLHEVDVSDASGILMSQTKYAADGSYATTTVDAAGDTKTTQYDSAGVVLADTWSHANGTSGSDTFAADGSVIATKRYSDGSQDTTTSGPQQLTTTIHYGAMGDAQWQSTTQVDGSVTRVALQPAGSGRSAYDDFLKDGGTVRTIGNGADGTTGHTIDGNSMYIDPSAGVFTYKFVDGGGSKTLQVNADVPLLENSVFTWKQGAAGWHTQANHPDDAAVTAFLAAGTVVDLTNGPQGLSALAARSGSDTVGFDGGSLYGNLGGTDLSPSVPVENFTYFMQAQSDGAAFASAYLAAHPVPAPTPAPSPSPTFTFLSDAEVEATFTDVPLGPNQTLTHEFAEAGDANVPAVATSANNPDDPTQLEYWLLTDTGAAPAPTPIVAPTVVETHSLSYTYALDSGGSETDIYAVSINSDGTASTPTLVSATVTGTDGTSSTLDASGHLTETLANGVTVSAPANVLASGNQWSMTGADGSAILTVAGTAAIGEANTTTLNFGGASVQVKNAPDPTHYLHSLTGMQTITSVSVPDGYDSVVTIQESDRTVSLTFGSSNELLSEAFVATDGSRGETVFFGDGSSRGEFQYADGNYTLTVGGADGTYRADNYSVGGARTSDVWGDSAGAQGKDFFALDGSSDGMVTRADGSYSLYTDDGHDNRVVSQFDASGNPIAPASPPVESITTSTASDGTVTTFDTLTQTDGSFTRTWTATDGRSGTDHFNAATGEAGGSSVSADGSDRETWDTLYLANGAVETKTSSLDAGGNGISIDKVQQADGSSFQTRISTDGSQTTETYDASTGIDNQAWSKSDGSHGTSLHNWTTQETGGSLVSADGSDHETWDTLYLANGAVETKTSSLDATGNGTSIDKIQQADGSSYQSISSTDGSQTTETYDAATTIDTQVWVRSDGSHGTNLHNWTTQETGGSLVTADGSDHETWDTQYLSNGAEETKTSSYDGAGNGSSVDKVKQADGSSFVTTTSTDGSQATEDFDAATGIDMQIWSKSDGSHGTTLHNWTTGETGGSLVSADGSDHETWDTLYLANGAVETKSSSLDANGNGTSHDSVQQADGAYEQQWTNSDGTAGMAASGVAGGAGDTFTWGRGLESSTLQTVSGNDKLAIGEGVAMDQLWFRQDGSDLDITILGTNDQLDVQGWFSGPGSQLQSISLADGQTLAGADVQKLVEAMASFAVPSSSQTQYTPAENASLEPLLAANWH